MSGDGNKLKSAYELAMERLRAKNPDAAGVELTTEQKDAIARLRSETRARLDELEFLHRGKLAEAAQGDDPAAAARLADEHRRERERLEEQRDRRIAEIRGTV